MKRKNFDLITNLKGKIMKKLILTTIIGGLSLSAFTGTSCSMDFYGNYNCFGTGQDSGYNSSTKRDFYGNDNKPFDAVSRGAITASAEEIVGNNRARSAKLRIAVKK